MTRITSSRVHAVPAALLLLTSSSIHAHPLRIELQPDRIGLVPQHVAHELAQRRIAIGYHVSIIPLEEADERARTVEIWQTSLIESLEQASDVERQRRSWLDASVHDVPTPTELICQIFDHTAVGDLLDQGTVFSDTTDAALRRLAAFVAELDLDLTPAALLSSTRWTWIPSPPSSTRSPMPSRHSSGRRCLISCVACSPQGTFPRGQP